MIGRVLWIAALLGLAVVTISVQLDRQSLKQPSLAQHVPEPFRASAQLAIAAFAIDDGKVDAGVSEARKLVQRRPMPAENLRLLAQAQFAAGELDASALTIQYAAQRGWRDPLAQEAMLQLALSNADTPEAARRYAALFVMRQTDDAMLEEIGRAVLAQPGGKGRTTLAEIVGGGERWHSLFLSRGARVMPPEAFTEIVEITLENGARYDCDGLRQAQRAVASRDERAGETLEASTKEECSF